MKLVCAKRTTRSATKAARRVVEGVTVIADILVNTAWMVPIPTRALMSERHKAVDHTRKPQVDRHRGPYATLFNLEGLRLSKRQICTLFDYR